MINFHLSRDDFEYDVRGLLMSFFPGEEFVKNQEEDAAPEEKAELTIEIPEGEGEDRIAQKNDMKRKLYHQLAAMTGKTLPWGALTGIRPTKIAMGFLEAGMSREEICREMESFYLVSPEKAALAADIAFREKEILKNIDYEQGYSLYIGIPFCPTTCLYCSFTSYPMSRWAPRMGEYLDALFREIDWAAEHFKGRKLNTIYIGGGTPTSLSPELLDRLLTKVSDSFDFSDLQEFTVEGGRPDSITTEKLQVLKKHPVTRISINPQTMQEETLRRIGRRHSVEDIRQAYQMARDLGFDNINMDIILGLPGEMEEDVAHTIEEIKKLAPDSLTVHSLAIKRASRLSQWIEENGMETLHNTDATMEIAAAGAAALGMKPYYLYRQKNMSGNFENVGYAREGKFGIYNILIMEEVQTIVALGAGSITKRVFGDGRIERCDNVKDVGLYIEKIDEMIERKSKLLGME